MSWEFSIIFDQNERNGRTHFELKNIVIPGQLEIGNLLFVLLLAIQNVSEEYLKHMTVEEAQDRNYQIAKQIQSFTKYLVLEGDIKLNKTKNP